MLMNEAMVRAARVAHEVHRAYCRGLGDATVPPWDETPPAARAGKVDGVGLVLAGAGAETCHARWVEAMQGQGWTYAGVKDLAFKTHPNLVPWAALPEEERVKDRLFVVVARGVLSWCGFRPPLAPAPTPEVGP